MLELLNRKDELLEGDPDPEPQGPCNCPCDGCYVAPCGCTKEIQWAKK